MISQEMIDKAAQLISGCKRVTALSGAGVSAESGISTYRDAGGLWDRYPEGSSGGIMAVMANHPEDAPQILMGFLEGIKNAKPNLGHLALVDLEEMGYLRAVITQNVDNLHREAGSSQVYEMHGNLYRLRCMKCNKKEIMERESYFKMIEDLITKIKRFSMEEIASNLPSCPCGGKARPDAVAFGEPVLDLSEATAEAKACDLMLILGTSGVVYPAASMPGVAQSGGAKLIEINPLQSALTARCDLFLEGKTGEILPRIVSSLREIREKEGSKS
ncbi:MAG: Sir2 family NAD-dependent protein deacetylase [Thermodesulfobacteriota bacterium]|nr:Sir2 family NAD-dependent protein deacetylase [Thermodesulfobacteriota bacterium]